MSLTEEEIRNCLVNDLNIGDADLERDTPLYSSGLLDSFSLVELVTLLESMVGVRIRPVDLTLDNFDSIGRIEEFLNKIQ